MEGYGLSSLGPTVGLSGLPDPMGDATAALEARRRQQVTDAGYPGAAADATNPFEGILSALGPTINERAVAAREAMRRGDMATANALNQSLALDFGQFLGSIKPIRAYHGSPYDFDRFDMSKIGTGEGAQAYGHGLYFAENEGVARSYRDFLRWKGMGSAAFDDPHVLAKISLDRYGSREESADRLQASVDSIKRFYGARLSNATDQARSVRTSEQAIALLRSGSELTAQPPKPGRMYEVNIHADPERFLDWDKPLSGQPKEVRAALGGIYDDAITGADIARLSAADARDVAIMRGDNAGTTLPESQRRASDGLRQLGIPGIKYLDQGSRAAGDGSRNYVVFDDKLIEILRKYGIMAPVAGAGLSALSLGDEEGM